MRPVSVRLKGVLRRLTSCGKTVRIILWCTAFLYLLFFLSEYSYRISAKAFSREEEERPFLPFYPETLPFSGVRAKANMKLIWEADGMQKEISEWLSFPPGETAGMDREEFAAYLEAYPLPKEMVQCGLTDICLEDFRGYEAVVSVRYAQKEHPRYRYFCRAEKGRLRVCDVSGQTLVLEQPLEKNRFSFEQLRRLTEGIYLEDYEAVIWLLRGTGENE